MWQSHYHLEVVWKAKQLLVFSWMKSNRKQYWCIPSWYMSKFFKDSDRKSEDAQAGDGTITSPFHDSDYISISTQYFLMPGYSTVNSERQWLNFIFFLQGKYIWKMSWLIRSSPYGHLSCSRPLAFDILCSVVVGFFPWNSQVSQFNTLLLNKTPPPKSYSFCAWSAMTAFRQLYATSTESLLLEGRILL